MPEQSSIGVTQSPKFVVDGMLGRLAKWLRVLGYDTVYHPTPDDSQLVRMARAEGRILLTRDRALARRRGLRCLLIESEHLADQRRQVIAELGLTTDGSFSRCPLCNTPLQHIARTAAEPRVPAHVFRTHQRFSLCPQCDRVYWPGTHRARMQSESNRLRSSTE